ncbi:MAG: hypothetical protein ACR2HE_02470 [Casimicrobiaceae bacterium]
MRKAAREIEVPEQSIRNWVKAQTDGKLGTTENGKPITPEQMEISRCAPRLCAWRWKRRSQKNRPVFCERVAVRYAFILNNIAARTRCRRCVQR